jgi:hypothetical protein
MTKARSSAGTVRTEFLTTALCTAFAAAWLTSPLILAVAWMLR